MSRGLIPSVCLCTWHLRPEPTPIILSNITFLKWSALLTPEEKRGKKMRKQKRKKNREDALLHLNLMLMVIFCFYISFFLFYPVLGFVLCAGFSFYPLSHFPCIHLFHFFLLFPFLSTSNLGTFHIKTSWHTISRNTKNKM